MPQLSNPISKAARTAARQAAQGLRLGANVLELLGSGPADQPAPERPAAAARARRATTARRPAAKRGSARRPQASARPKPLGDVTIARKVETELFRDPDVPKGDINVNVVEGVVFLRGQVRRPDDIKRLEAEAQAIPEVKRVENLLHLPKTPAPTRADTPKPQQKPAGRRTKPRSPEVKATRTVNTEVPVPGAEPSPNEVARTGAGRQPSPLGASDETRPPEPSLVDTGR